METPCILCGRTDGRVIWHEAGYDGRACPCGTVCVTPEPPDGSIDPTRDIHPERFYALPARAKAAWIARRRPSRGSLLEVGCGEGAFLDAAREQGFTVEGMEPHPARARRVEERLGVAVHREFIEESALPDARYDVVFHCDLLSHFPDPVRALRAMKRLLRPGGALFFEAGVLGGMSPWWYRLIGNVGYPMHRWLYTREGFETLLAKAGLRVVERERFGLAPYVLASDASRALRKPLKLALDVLDRARARPAWAPTSKSLDDWNDHFENFMRYRAARHAPEVGPQTVWYLAEPAG